uniref:heavy metal-associated isoprenylated plant protein 32-like n=1 Tax=Erigeron canadensis TaxID=72917 RepID=UPI001CB940E5|nr:heavy metal-associated isoprenylated plant protein 32-like [Erigeron canadensis]
MGGGGGGNNGYFHGARPEDMAGYPYHQQQSAPAMMSQQRAANGNERFRPMMYARQPPELGVVLAADALFIGVQQVARYLQDIRGIGVIRDPFLLEEFLGLLEIMDVMGFFYHSATSLFVDDFHETCVLKVNIHCDGCKQKVRKVLTNIKGVHGVKIESEQGKVLVSGNVDKQILLKKLSKSGKHAEIWGVSQKQVQMKDLSKNMQIDGGKSGGGGDGGEKDGKKSVKFDASASDDDEEDDSFKKPGGGGPQVGNMMRNPQFMKGGGGRGNMNGGHPNHGGGGCQSHNSCGGGSGDINGGVQGMQNMMSMCGGGGHGMGPMGHMGAVEELPARGPMGGNNGYFHAVGPEAMTGNPYYQQQSGGRGYMNGGNQNHCGGGGCQSHNNCGGGRGIMSGGVHGMQNMMSMRGGGGGGGMGSMGHMGSVEGLPTRGPMGGNNVYFHGTMAGNPYYQQQSVAAMMNQQQTANGNQRFQPMMYARQPPEVNYMPQPIQPSYPSYPYPQPPHNDPLTNYFSDENTSSSCNIM